MLDKDAEKHLERLLEELGENQAHIRALEKELGYKVEQE